MGTIETKNQTKEMQIYFVLISFVVGLVVANSIGSAYVDCRSECAESAKFRTSNECNFYDGKSNCDTNCDSCKHGHFGQELCAEKCYRMNQQEKNDDLAPSQRLKLIQKHRGCLEECNHVKFYCECPYEKPEKTEKPEKHKHHKHHDKEDKEEE